jgi:hypothetical protein
MVSDEHITASAGRRPQEIDDIMALAIRVNDFLSGLFSAIGIRLVDFKMEFGRLWETIMMRIILADEISPDSAAGCGTSSPTRSSTRTASAATSAARPKPIRKSPAGSLLELVELAQLLNRALKLGSAARTVSTGS